MVLHINDLPYEILSTILEEVADSNTRDGPQYTYGLSQAPEPLHDVPIQRIIRARLAPDTLRWHASSAIRQVHRQWHDWAVDYALRDVQISRWRGSERWMQSRTLSADRKNYSGIAVYRDPYRSLRKTVQLFKENPSLTSCVRKIWFHGYHGAETNALIFKILRRCSNLGYVTLPWTALRYGDIQDWSHLLGRNEQGRSIYSLELLAVDLKESQRSNAVNQVDRKALYSSRVDFSGLRRLKIFGHANFIPLTDEDLIAISHTAVNLKEIHITGTASVSIDSITALMDSSDQTLEILEHSPLSADGFEHPDPTSSPHHKDHLCQNILNCPHLRDLSLSTPSICHHLFADLSVKWCGDVQIRAATICGRHPLSLKTSEQARTQLWAVLDQARVLMASRRNAGADLNIEIFIDNWIFEPRRSLVHGNMQIGELVSDGAWPSRKAPSSKGPYGQTGLYGKHQGPYEYVSEAVFAEGLEKHYLSF